jgi:hypothetical protein
LEARPLQLLVDPAVGVIAMSNSRAKKDSVGIIGANPDSGWAAQAHIPALRSLSDDFEITALSTTRRESRAAASRSGGNSASSLSSAGRAAKLYSGGSCSWPSVKMSIVAPSQSVRLSEYGADAAQGEQLEGDRLRRVRSLEGVAEVAGSLDEIAQRQLGEADPAQGGDDSPAVVDLAARRVAGKSQPERLLVVAHAVCAQAGPVQCVPGAANVTDAGEELICLPVKQQCLRVALLSVGKDAELADRTTQELRVPESRRFLVTCLERGPCAVEVVQQQLLKSESRK